MLVKCLTSHAKTLCFVLWPANDRELLNLLEEVSDMIKPVFYKISLVMISS